jgi:hypothetical protein
MGKTIRLGIGEAIPPGQPSFKAQRIFLEMLFSEKAAAPAIRELAAIAEHPAAAKLPGMYVEDEVLVWGAKWHLHDPAEHCDHGGWWLIRTMQHHVNHWREFPRYRGHFLGFIQVYRAPTWPQAPSWNPNDATEEHYRFEIERYIRTIKKHPEYVAAPKKSEMGHFTWLTLHQVCAWSPARIARERSDHADVRAISKAIRETANMIGLTPRPARRGRPKKTTRKSTS